MWIARYALLSLLLLTLGAGPAGAVSTEEDAGLRQQEEKLLHRRIDLSTLLRWQPATKRWLAQPPRPGKLLLIHLWAVECAPCVAEMPQLGRVLLQLRDLPLRAVLVSETLNDKALQDFLLAHAQELGEVEHYRVVDGRVRKALQNRMQPVTLLVDQGLVVRQAFIGSLVSRRSALIDSIERLSAALKAELRAH